MAGQYPEIEKIFVDYDVYIHRMRLDEKILKMNPLTASYQEGYKQCYEDIKNSIRELIDKEDETDLTEEESEAQRTDAAERETHRQEVEGDIDEG